jgi:hypothetical protein
MATVGKDSSTAETRFGQNDSAGEKAAEAAEPVKKRAGQFAEEQKQSGAERIGTMATAIHGAARELEDRMPVAAAYVHDAAARMEDAASTLRQRSVDDLMKSLDSFAQTRPGALFGGAVLTGFALSRFLKSSSHGHGGRRF